MRTVGAMQHFSAPVVRPACCVCADRNLHCECLGAESQNTPAGSAPPQAPTTLQRGSIPVPVERRQARFVQSLAPAQSMRVTLILLPPRRSDLEKLVAQITDPQSPNYRQFLTFQQWKQDFAPSENDMSIVADWANKAGLSEVYRFPTNTGIVVQSTVDTVQRALSIQLSEYEFEGHHFFANNRRPSLPPSIAARVDNILGLNSFEQLHAAGSGPAIVDMPAPRAPSGGPFISRSDWLRDTTPHSPSDTPRRESEIPRNAITGPLGGTVLEPPDLWSPQAYDYNALFRLSHCCNPTNLPNGSPKEMSIAIVGNNKPNPSDYQTFIATYNLAAYIHEITIDGSSCCDAEMTLDIEWAAAMSNSFGSWQQTAQLFVYESAGNLINDYITALNTALAEDNARILSTSFESYEDKFGCCAHGDNWSISDFRDITTAMIATGWTIIAAAGDNGAYDDCQTLSVGYPPSDPNVIAAGGTQISLSRAGSGLAFGGETSWSGNGCANPGGNGGGGGGGCSNTFFAPWWSSPFALCPGSRRALPDIALNAGSVQEVFYGQWRATVGTSLVAPELAGFFAHAASYLAFIEFVARAGTCGKGYNGHCVPIGHPGPAFYLSGSRPFYDVRDGSCNGGGVGQGYCTTPGYDLATGPGSANMLQLAWAINQSLSGHDDFRPLVTFSGPPTHAWYGTDQTVTFIISGGTMGIAGFTAQWDRDPGEGTIPPPNVARGAGDPFWDGPSVPFGTNGSLSLAAAGPGCHTAFVRAWNNLGTSSETAAYGPLCSGAPPVCRFSGFFCLVHDDNPPDYTVKCDNTEDFYLVFPDGSQSFIRADTMFTGTSSLYGGDVQACDSGTNNCDRFSIFADAGKWCHSGQTGPHPHVSCRACIEAGGMCGPSGCTF